MNPHPRYLVTLPTYAWFGFVSLVGATLLVCLLASATNVKAQQQGWRATGSLGTARSGHTATLLANGKVLVVGGFNVTNPCCRTTGSAELYDPATGLWSATGSLSTPRGNHVAVRLTNGKVLVAGGHGDPFSTIMTSAEIYDPNTGAWSTGRNLSVARGGARATLLADGRVLVTGGPDNSAEIYDPATGSWSVTGSLNTVRSDHTATLLPNGKVLVVSANFERSAELYDPATGSWTATSDLTNYRIGCTATLLPNGKVLVAGGALSDHCDGLDAPAELYDPAPGQWSATGSLSTSRAGHTATLLPNGKVLVAAGDHECTLLNSAELYDPATGSWSVAGSLNTARSGHTATLLPNGRVLVAGGDAYGSLNTAELYDAGTSNQIDDSQFFVHQHYLDFLNREPDAGGLAYWTNRIAECGSDARCIHERRIGVSAAFFIELEFQDTGYYVYRFYKASFGRQPNYAEFTSDRSKVIAGSSLEASKQAFADEWVQRSVFLQAYPNTMSNTEVVNKLFNTAGLTGSIYDAQRQQQIQAMNAGRSRALVLRDVIEIPDFKNIPNPQDLRYSEIKQTSQYNPAFVLMQYFGYLRRHIDQDGYDFWLDVLNNREPNNYRGMICAFITSAEYQHRFGSVTTRSNADCGQ